MSTIGYYRKQKFVEELFILLTIIYKKWSGGGAGAYSIGVQIHRNTDPLYTLVSLDMKKRMNKTKFYKGAFEFQLFKRKEMSSRVQFFPKIYVNFSVTIIKQSGKFGVSKSEQVYC